eukprot:6200190-Pleurochrysis_carterae.AAC.1
MEARENQRGKDTEAGRERDSESVDGGNELGVQKEVGRSKKSRKQEERAEREVRGKRDEAERNRLSGGRASRVEASAALHAAQMAIDGQDQTPRDRRSKYAKSSA